ncbi:AraC family transcriptional regulator [Hymenobacter sp. 15J16-1T3B]|uniref:AraC family transcriptional regulator n=1 Tax=Hymenobacter sp. 15J16-1T3B TaxID=2886941 RepID=UPI001D0F7396|nr:helix-turn-helix transcriptional regulator [Hymenobacter sp. 15J16-1T3B]MCC3158958.1 AraC family transcriptional regulator [Hymenobacter sp. 15J16-1T3B]
MTTPIPTYPLQYFSAPAAEAAGVFFLDDSTHTDGPPMHTPYRGDYYKIGLCLRGSAELQANLETYAIGPGDLMLITPHTIKQWTDFSADHDSLSLFFTRDFMTAGHRLHPEHLQFLDGATRHVLPLAAAEAASIQASLLFLRDKLRAPHAYRDDIVKNLINSLLYEVVAAYERQREARRGGQSRGQLIAADFKQLVNAHCLTERSVAFYGEQLCITPKHLSETVREATGKTASAWIEEAVMLEAKARLLNPALTVAQVAEQLHFADASAFSRFFKKSHGRSPKAYKQVG